MITSLIEQLIFQKKEKKQVNLILLKARNYSN